MLGNRKMAVDKRDSTVQGSVSLGCPQGGIISSLLWNLVMVDLLTKISKMGLQAVGCTDDLMIVSKRSSLETLTGVMQEAVKLTVEWCDGIGIKVIPGKVKVMVCTRNYKRNRRCQLKMGGQELRIRIT